MVHWYYFQKWVTYYKTLIWPKSTVEMSSKTKTKSKLTAMFVSSSYVILPVPFHEIKYMEKRKMQIWKRNVNRNKCACLVREINARTIEFKKRWHIYCNINVIYIVFFLLKKTENSNSCCRSFLMYIDNTFSFETRTNLSINQRRLKNKMEVALLGIWSSYEAFLGTRLWATIQLCSWDAIC